MTATARHHDHTVTDSGHERMSERASGTARVLPIRPDLAPDSRAHARSHGPHEHVKTNAASRVRDFVSLHVGEAKTAVGTAELTSTTPPTLRDIADRLTAAKTDARNAGHFLALLTARLFQLAAHALAYTICSATGTDKRAAIALALTLLILTTATLTGLIAG